MSFWLSGRIKQFCAGSLMSVWNVGGEDLSLECVGDGGLGLD